MTVDSIGSCMYQVFNDTSKIVSTTKGAEDIVKMLQPLWSTYMKLSRDPITGDALWKKSVSIMLDHTRNLLNFPGLFSVISDTLQLSATTTYIDGIAQVTLLFGKIFQCLENLDKETRFVKADKTNPTLVGDTYGGLIKEALNSHGISAISGISSTINKITKFIWKNSSYFQGSFLVTSFGIVLCQKSIDLYKNGNTIGRSLAIVHAVGKIILIGVAKFTNYKDANGNNAYYDYWAFHFVSNTTGIIGVVRTVLKLHGIE